MKLTITYILFLFLLPHFLFAQNRDYTQPNFPEPKFDIITMEDGLPENAIRGILQDRFGYLWLATQNGLVRYDGYEMRVYSWERDNPISVNHRWIRSMFEDKRGTLWIGTEIGLNRFDWKSEGFYRYLDSIFVRTIYEDFNGNFWIGADNIGLLLFDRTTEKIKIYEVNERNNIIYSILESNDGSNLYIGTDAGLFTLDINNRNIKSLSQHTLIQNSPTYSLFKSSNGSIWVGSENGLTCLDSETVSDAYSLKSDLPIRHIIEDDEGFIWCYAGSQLYASTGNKLIILDTRSKKYKRINSDIVMSLMKDRTGIIWIGAGWANLKKWDKNKWKFKSYKNEIDNKNSLSSNHVRAVLTDTSNILWIGTLKGLDKFDRNTGVYKHYSFKNDEITALHKENQGMLWIGTNSSGLVKFNPTNESVRYFMHNKNDTTSISANGIQAIYTSSYGELWVGTWYDGVNRMEEETGKFRRYSANGMGGLADNQVFYINEDSERNLWVTTSNGGLNKYDRNLDIFSSSDCFRKDFQNTSVIYAFEDSKMNFWVGTYFSGLHLFDKRNGISIKNFSTQEGLPNNCTVGIFEDNSGNLWTKTFNGVVKLNPESGSIKTYYVADGLPSDLTGFFYPHQGSTGEIFMGGFNGLYYFHPDSIKYDPIPPKVIISNLSLFNRENEILNYDGFISEIKEINLPHNHNDLRFDFVALHFGEPSKNKYKYILENFDEDWVDAGTQRNATYTNLSPGEYIFRVIACNRDGIWNEEGALLKLIISPPFWATWWAYSLYIIFFGSILFGIRRYEMNRVNLKNRVKLDEVKLKEKEETDKMKSRFFANISHEFRTPLTLILGPSEKIINEELTDDAKKQAGIIRRNAQSLLGLVNQLLDLSKLEAGKLKLQASKFNIVPFVKGITMSFESLAERKGIQLKFISEKEEIDLYFDRDKMAKILTNLLSNAFKFTEQDEEIRVSLTLVPSPLSKGLLLEEGRGMSGGQGEGKVQITVTDTGIGISEEELPKLFDRFYQVDSSQTREHEGTGIGLALTKELVELHKGTIKVKSKVREGSEFTVMLPVGREHLKDDEIVEVSEENANVILSGAKNLSLASLEDSVSHFDNLPTGQAGLSVTKETDASDEKTIILVVEDNSDVRAYIKDSLGNNFQIEEAMNGEIGVEKAKEIIPDLIISDIMMPKMDGNELTRRIKNDEITSHIPVILLTAKSEQESKLEGLETGADDYLTKPFDTKELQVRIKNLINTRKKLQKKFSSGNYIEKADKKKLSSLDEKFMNKVNEVIENHYYEESFSIEEFNDEIGMGDTQIYRKLKALTGKSPSRYIRSLRLAKARKMILNKDGNINEIAYSVGFSSPQYFARCFKEEFGYPPSKQIQ